MNKLKRQLFPHVVITAWNHQDCLAGDKMQQDIRNWLSPPDPWKNHNLARRSQHSGTGTWFIRGNTLSEWKASGPSSLLWVLGKRQLPSSAYSFPDANNFSRLAAGSGKCTLVR